MWVEGLSGTHRTHEDLGSEKFIQEARIQTIIFLKNGLIAHRTHIKKILDKHSKHAILSITKSKGYSYQRAPELNRNDFSVVLQAYGLFAIPLAKIEIKFSDHQLAGCTRL